MSTLQPDHSAMRDSPTYLPILRSVLKSQIQFLVEQLSDAGEETLILSANVTDGQVDQLGSESGKLFVDVYDDFKSEFLGFCQRRKGKRKYESPQKTPLDVKRGKTTPAVLSIAKASVQSGISPQNVPKVSAARVIVSQKPTTTQAKSVPGNQLTQESSDEPDIGELEQSEEDYTEIESSELGYGVLEDVETWQETDTEGVETPSSSQDLASSSQDQSSVSRVKTVSLQKKTVTTQNPNMIITSAGNMKTIRFEKSVLMKNTCMYCNKVFGSERDMKLHMRSHTGEKPYKCEVCEQLFSLKRSLERHVLKQHAESKRGTFPCDKCGKVFAQKVTLKTHSLRHGEKKYHCKCGKSFFTKTELNNHNRFMHFEGERKPPKKRFICRFCDVRYARKENLTIHIKTHHENDDPEFYCNICDKYFYARKSFKAHNRRHGEKNFQCSKCAKLFVTEAELNLHEAHGHKELRRRKFKCNKCGKSFASMSSLKRHSVRHGEKTLRCDECWKMFYTITELRQHMNCMHYVGEKKPSVRFACDICEATYARKENLMHHIRVIHEKIEKKIICEICNKGFSSKWSLWVHKKRHGEKTVQCSKCAKLFFTLTELHQHDKHSHNKEKKPETKAAAKDQNTPINLEKMFSKAVSCGECGKLFIRGDALELHMLSHTGEYPFTCQVCGLGYRKKRSYIIHMTKKHPEVPIEDN